MKNIVFSILLLFSLSIFSQKEKTLKLHEDITEVKASIPVIRNSLLKTRTGYYKSDDLFFQITLIDNNFNNLFNDANEDRINIHHEKTETIRLHFGVSFQSLKDKNYIQANYRTLEITHIDPKGEFLQVKEILNSTEPTIKLVNKLPDLNFKLLNDSTVNFRDFIDGDHYIFVEFWGTWCKGCVQILPRIEEIYNLHKEKLSIIYLNSKDSFEEINDFVSKHNLTWINGIATKEIENEFLLNGYPYGVLFNKNGDVIKFSCHYTDLKEILDNTD